MSMIERRLLELIINRFLGSSNRSVTGTGEYRTEDGEYLKLYGQTTIDTILFVGTNRSVTDRVFTYFQNTPHLIRNTYHRDL